VQQASCFVSAVQLMIEGSRAFHNQFYVPQDKIFQEKSCKHKIMTGNCHVIQIFLMSFLSLAVIIIKLAGHLKTIYQNNCTTSKSAFHIGKLANNGKHYIDGTIKIFYEAQGQVQGLKTFTNNSLTILSAVTDPLRSKKFVKNPLSIPQCKVNF
jgi:hypothetical protein